MSWFNRREAKEVGIVFDTLEWSSVPNGLDSDSVAGAESDSINCERFGTIAIKVEYSANNVTAPIWVVLLDKNGEAMYTIPVTSGNTGENNHIQESGYYSGEGMTVSTLGAKNLIFVLKDVPTNSGLVSTWAKPV